MGLLEEGGDYSEEENEEREEIDPVLEQFVEKGMIRKAAVRTVMVKSSPTMNVFCQGNPAVITIDCGAEADMIRRTAAVRLGIQIHKSRHGTSQADGKTPLQVVGEVHTTFSRGGRVFHFSGIVVEELDCDILGGVPFLERNDITPRCAKKQIIFSDGEILNYGAITKSVDSNTSIRRAAVLRVEETRTLWPGDHIDLKVDEESLKESEVAIEPRFSRDAHEWFEPSITQSVDGVVRLINSSSEPYTIRKHEHIGEISSTFTPDIGQDTGKIHEIKKVRFSEDHIKDISVDPDNILSPSIKGQFESLHRSYSEVFNPEFTGYNHAFGKFEAVVNMGNVKPPQRKGKLPQYSRNKLELVQDHFDKLERLGVFAKPEDVGVNIEYLNPSFLVKKGDNNFRLVTAFTEVGKYCKPQPTLLPTVDSTLRSIAHWKYIIKTDLKSAYYQIPLSVESMKYCGTSSPFKGSRVYTRCAMGMPGSESALEELLSRIIGELIAKGIVVKMADDLYCGGQTEEELLRNWAEVLKAFATANMRLTAPKTIIAPLETVILDWIWNQGKLRASPHKISALSKCSQPITVKDMRSFLGAYKVLSRVIPRCSMFLQKLNKSTSGKISHQKIEWNDELTSAFERAQKHLMSSKVISLPREDDQLFLVTDGATSHPCGIAATLYIRREDKLRLAGFFSQQINTVQSEKWFPCEIEGLAIAAAIKFFDAYVAQSSHRAKVLTDSKPCCDAYNILCRGEFSSNARLATFLNTVSRYHVTVNHLPGEANALSDFGLRNPIPCVAEKCQVCLFTRKLDSTVVRSISVADVKSGKAQVPFTNRRAWIETQSECSDLRRVKAQLIQGTRPSKKETTIPNVKRYLSRVTIASDGLIVVRRADPLSSTREAIVVPVLILPGLVTALHIKFEHPTASELLTILQREFFGLNMSKVVDEVTNNCHPCAALAKIPKSFTINTTSEPPASFGSQFACDVIRRERQRILLIREYVSSYTLTSLITSEQHEDLREALIKLLVSYVPLDGPYAIVRTDPASGFKALRDNELLKKYRIQLEIGRAKNVNKNPVAERGVQELEEVIRKIETHNEAINDYTLALATSRLNSKIRSNGLSAREVLIQRDQLTNNPIPLNDRDIILDKHARALKDHEYSEKINSMNSRIPPSPVIAVGDLVYLYSERDKHHPRCRYLVTGVDGMWLQIRKFTGSQLRALSYKVRLQDVYKVPSQVKTSDRTKYFENDHEEHQLSQTDKTIHPETCTTADKLISVTPSNEQCPASKDIPIDIALPPNEEYPVSEDIPTEIASPPNENEPEDSDSNYENEVQEPMQEGNQTPPRRSLRERQPPGYLKDYKTS